MSLKTIKRAVAPMISAGALSLGAGAVAQTPVAASDAKRPNIVLIVADDLGFSDLGSYGGEIKTPNLDRLAFEGVRFTNFYVAPTCSPTRSMLMTGLDNHVVGMGNMYEQTAPNQIDQPGFEGVLQQGRATFADVLRQNGYRTYMAGKWHLGHAPESLPSARGFDRTFSLLNGAGSHFNFTGATDVNEKSEFTADGEYLTRLPKGYYSTKTFTDKMIEFIDRDRASGAPFLAYLAYQAPHDPLQVPNSWVRRYKGAYDDGWDDIREQRLARMKELGIMDESASLSPRLWYVPAFDDLTGIAQYQLARRMEVYASMVEYMDKEIGRLVDYLDEIGELDNTIIVFFSDNGPSPADPVQQASRGVGKVMAANFYVNKYETAFESWGRSDSFVAQGPAWAQVSATPFNGFKLTSFDGGMRSPLIVWRPGVVPAGGVNTTDILHVSDVGPTILSAAGVPISSLWPADTAFVQTGRPIPSLAAGVETGSLADRQFGMELFGGRAYRDGPWKITWMHAPYGVDDWQLFNLEDDPAETTDLSAQHPETKARLIAAWEDYAAHNNIILPDRTLYDGMEDNLPPRPPVDSPGWPRGQEKNWIADPEDDDDNE